MSELFYNRDRNVTGVTPITGLIISPKQGSSVTFTTRIYETVFPNKVKARMGQSLNSVKAEYNLMFGSRETEAAQIIDYLESRSGVLPAVLEDVSNIYQTISGFADEFSFSTAANNSFETTCRLVIDNRSAKTNWSGLSFLNFDFQQWQAGETIPKYAIRYFEYDSSNKFNNYFYSTGEHISSAANGPFSTGSFWSQDLFFEQDVAFSVGTQPDIGRVELNGSFPVRITDKKNIHNIESATLRFSNVSTEKAKALLHFAETKFGETKFLYQCPKIYKPKVFYCPTWRHTWNFSTHTVEFDISEDPLGILPRNNSPAITMTQNNGWNDLEFSTYSTNDLSVISYDGGERVSAANGEVLKHWDDTNVEHTIDVYGPVTGLLVSDHRINSLVVGETSKVKNLSAPRNQLSFADLGSCRKLEHVDLGTNSLTELTVDGLTNLQTIDISSNRISILDITDCQSLTGIRASGNLLSSAQINSHLDALVNFGNYSGNYDVADGEYVDFENNDLLSGQGFSDAAILGWRSWSLNFDNAKIPFAPLNYSQVAAQYEQESITGVVGGQSIFTWDDSIGNYNASRFVISDHDRPQYVPASIGQRSALRFNGDSYLTQTISKSFGQTYGIFAVVKPSNSGMMTVFSDRFDRGLFISGNRLRSEANLTDNTFGELSGDSWNVVGFYSDVSGISGAVNSQTPSGAVKSANNLTFPGVIGRTYTGAFGNGAPKAYYGDISEIVITSGVTDFAKMMRDLGAKHGIEIL